MKTVYQTIFGISEAMIMDLLDPMVSNYYNQNVDINGFAGIITGAGFIGKPLKLVHGIEQIPRGLMAKLEMKKHVTLKNESKVTKIDLH